MWYAHTKKKQTMTKDRNINCSGKFERKKNIPVLLKKMAVVGFKAFIDRAHRKKGRRSSGERNLRVPISTHLYRGKSCYCNGLFCGKVRYSRQRGWKMSEIAMAMVNQ